MTNEEEYEKVFACLDCKVNTGDIEEYYMVTEHVWRQTGLGTHDGMLCIGCLEARIGRRLVNVDFLHAPVNVIGHKSTRFQNRFGEGV